MKASKFTLLLILSAFIVFFCDTSVLADDYDDIKCDLVLYNGEYVDDCDGDGVPDFVEQGHPGLFGEDHLYSNVATLPSATDPNQYFTLLVDPYFNGLQLSFKNVEAIETPADPLSAQAALATPFGFVKFEVSGASTCDPVMVTLILHGFFADNIDDLDLVRYSPTMCATDSGDTSYCLPGRDVDSLEQLGNFMTFYLEDGQLVVPDPTKPGVTECRPAGSPSFIGAPVLEESVDIDEDKDGILIFEDNCPVNSNEDQADADDDGIGDACDNCSAVSNFKQLDSNNNGIGDICESEEVASATIFSYLGHTYRRHFSRDVDIWELDATKGSKVVVRVKSHPDIKDGYGKRVDLYLLGKTRGDHLVRIDRSKLDPENMVEAEIPEDGTYFIRVSQPSRRFWRPRGRRAEIYRGEVELTVEAQQEILDSIRATHWVEEQHCQKVDSYHRLR